jgi:DNA-binding SARP family transcriptional activator
LWNDNPIFIGDRDFVAPKEMIHVRFNITRDRITNTYVVYRVGGNPEQHVHMKKKSACRRLIGVLKCGDYPYSPWMIKCARRLLTEDEFECLKKPKDRYINQVR